MKNSPLAAYFILLALLCAAVIGGAKMLGQQGAYLAQFYMLTPALAALATRLFFYRPRFSDANLRLGKLSDYFKFWLLSLGISALSYGVFTLLGAVSWDFSGNAFLERLTQQFAAAGQDIKDTLPPGFTPQMMLMIFFVGGLTVFNLPGIITGFGEEFGHRGFMFPLLYRIKPWVGILVGALIWYVWHWPLLLVIPQTVEYPAEQMLFNYLNGAIGALCAFVYLAYVYVKSRSVFVAALAHIALNNSAQSFSYFAVLQNQALANVGLTLTMVLVVAALYYRKELAVFATYFADAPRVDSTAGTGAQGTQRAASG